jgi:hypothetical protein
MAMSKVEPATWRMRCERFFAIAVTRALKYMSSL